MIWSTADVGTEQDAGIFAFERTGGDAATSYALIVLNTNEAQVSSTSNGTSVMQTTLPPNTVLVDVLNAGLPTYHGRREQPAEHRGPCHGRLRPRARSKGGRPGTRRGSSSRRARCRPAHVK